MQVLSVAGFFASFDLFLLGEREYPEVKRALLVREKAGRDRRAEKSVIGSER